MTKLIKRMQEIKDKINEIRENEIKKNYEISEFELCEKVKKDPFATKFVVSSGCISEHMAEELAHRYTKQGLVTTAVKSGGQWTLHILVLLPSYLVGIPKQN